MANLNLSRLGKTYAGGVIAVSDVSVEIEHGEFIVLVGPRAAANPPSCV